MKRLQKKQKIKYLVVCVLIAGLVIGLILTQAHIFVKADDEVKEEIVVIKKEKYAKTVEKRIEIKEKIMDVARAELKKKEEYQPEPQEASIIESAEVFVEEPVVEEIIFVEEVVEEPIGDSCFGEDIEYGSYYEDVYDIPENNANEGMQLLGGYTITWYSREAVGYDAPGASGLGCVPYATCALPDSGLLGCTVHVEGYGTYLCTDISPGGICDLYVESNADIPGYGQDYQNVWIVG